MKRTDGQKRLSARLTHRKAFTLVELLVVIAIIGILFVVLISKVDFATEKAKATGVQTDFRSYQLAIETVARENAGLSTLVDDAASGEEKYAALEAALNTNLDPKLRVEIDENGNITTDAKDPWKEEYTGQYLAPDADGTVKDRGAIVMYSKGSNLKLGTTSETVNGVVNITLESGKETEGADDYAISTIYTYVNGYGEIKTTTEGFSNDIGDANNTPSDKGESDNVESNKLEKVEIWIVMGGEAYNFADILAEEGATLNVHLVDVLPESFPPFDENMILHIYVIEDTGIAYTNLGPDLDGGLVVPVEEPLTLGEALLPVDRDCGWTENINSETEDGVYCVRVEVVEVIEIWMVDSGETINFTNLLKQDGATINTHLVDTLPDTMIPLDMENGVMDAYILESTGVIYGNLDGTVMTLGQLMADGAAEGTAFDKGWSENIYSETEDGFYCVRTYEKTKKPASNNAGLFDAEDNLVASWDELVNTYGMNVEKNYSPDTLSTDVTSPYYILTNYADFANGTKLVIGNNIEKIGDYAFIACVNLTNITIPDSVKSIGKYTFGACNGLKSVTIPDSVKNMGEYAFTGCANLTSVIIGNGVSNIGNYAFESCRKLMDVTIGNGVTNINDYAFYYCTSLENIIIPDNVKSIGSHAFQYCTGLTSVIIGDGVTNISEAAFWQCENLTSVTIGDGITNIGAIAFADCRKLTDITIGNSIVNFERDVFSNCIKLETITLKSQSAISYTPSTLLGSCYALTAIYVPADLVDAYKTAEGWSYYADKIQAIPTT